MADSAVGDGREDSALDDPCRSANLDAFDFLHDCGCRPVEVARAVRFCRCYQKAAKLKAFIVSSIYSDCLAEHSSDDLLAEALIAMGVAADLCV